MGAAESLVDGREREAEPGDHLAVAADPVEVTRNGLVAGSLGVLAAGVAIAYLARAWSTGAALDWVFAAGLGAVAVGWLLSLLDSRAPLLVADAQGVRIRLGRTWHGLPWTAVREVEHQPRRGLLRDGRLVVHPHNPERFESELDAGGRRQVALARRVHGASLAIPLGVTTRVRGAVEDLAAALRAVSADAVAVVEPLPVPEVTESDEVAESNESAGSAEGAAEASAEHPAVVTDDPDATQAWVLDLRETVDGDVDDVADDVDMAVVAAPEPVRDLRPARRSEVSVLIDDLAEEGAPAEEGRTWDHRVRPIAQEGEPVEPLVIDDFTVEPADDPVIGPELAAARTRLGLGVDQLAERTRIRPHVIESIEVDDFAPCGGDFYARGHLRTLARVLGIDAAPLLTSYDERYSNAPVNPRRVFEAELATGANGSIRATRGGPNWSVLVAAVMAVVLCWSIARLVMDSPADIRPDQPVLNGSGGPAGAGGASVAEPVPVVVATPDGGAHVVVRDGAGEIVFKGSLAAGQSKELEASPPVRVQSSDGAATVALDGAKPRRVGEQGVAGQSTFVVR
jgi:hypothetical protein